MGITTLNHATVNCQTRREANVILRNCIGPTTVEHSSRVHSFTSESVHLLNLSTVIHTWLTYCDISWVKLNYCYRQLTAALHSKNFLLVLIPFSQKLSLWECCGSGLRNS